MSSYLAIGKASYPKAFTSSAVSLGVGEQEVYPEPIVKVHNFTCAC
jgi:hypothetical protein